MKKVIVIVVIAVLWSFGGIMNAQTQQEIQEIVSLLKQEHFVSLVNKVCEMREKEYYKNAFMDYCLAYGYCQLGRPQLSTEWFDHLINSYNTISSVKIRELDQLKIACQKSVEVEPSAAKKADNMVSFLKAMNPDGFEAYLGGFEGKMGYPNQNEKVTEVDFEHVIFDSKNRQFTQQQKLYANNYYDTLLNDNSLQCDSTKHLLIYYPKNAKNIKNQILELENYYEYYERIFNLIGSNRLITIFYCLDRTTFDKVAHKVHNLTVPKSTYGYASSYDLVMLGIASPTWLGAMKHELFHIMIRSFIGDIPAWLDEGIACCFESSSLKDDQIKVNMKNYRSDLLLNLNTLRMVKGQFFKPIPLVEEFTNFSWLQYSGNPGDLKINASINYSLSFVFVKFLMDNNKLIQVVNDFRNRSITQIQNSSDIGENYTTLRVRPSNEILTGIMVLDMKAIQSSFEVYCKKIYGENFYSNSKYF